MALLSACTRDARQPPAVAGPDRAAAVQVPQGYTVQVAAGPDLVDYPMFATTDGTGRLFVFESAGDVYEKTEDALRNPQFRINLLEDQDGDGRYDKSTIFADKVGFPQGGVFYKGSLYASSAPDLLKLTDTDGDGKADKREVLLTGWTLNVNANSLIGPFMGPDGWLYMTSAIMGFDVTTQEGKRLKGGTARIWRVRPDGSGLEWVSAGGMNNPVELAFTEAAEPIGTETYFTEPQAGQRDALVYWTEGGVYPKPNGNIDRDSLVRTGDLLPVVSKYSRVSPAGIGRYRGTALGDGFKDNLFSAQFNTHRIIRHKLIREGDSFRTEDEPFFTVNNEDFHPTDVLEDGDGSLLVVETGGWFIKGCPLSQVSKPELQGAIYRVRRKDAPAVDDPFGNAIAWSRLDPAQTASLLADTRPFVRDRAVQRLVDQGDASVAVLSDASPWKDNADARTKAVFALYRIGTATARTAVRAALTDGSVPVRVAAARASGLAKDSLAVGKLLEMAGRDDPAARRQALTALGQIKSKRTAPALLATAQETAGPFERHALIYALVALNQPAAVVPGLAHASPAVREAALIALDQMPASTLRSGQITAFLSGKSQALRRTALWVASHHPEWAAEMTAYLRGRFRGAPLSAGERELYTDLLVALSKEAGAQQFLAEELERGSSAHKLFVLDAMAKSRVKEIPSGWVEALGLQLAAGKDPQVQARVLELVRLRGITGLQARLTQVAGNDKNPPALRLDAIGALLEGEPALSEPHFAYLYAQLQPERQAPVRQQAASVLERGKLSDAQLLRLATNYLPHADAFILPRLVPVFEGAHSSEIGKKLAAALMRAESLDGFSEERMKTVFARYPADVQPDVDKLLAKLRTAQAGRLAKLKEMEGRIAQGDLERGRTLFYGKAICYTCHRVGAEGGKLGPDLTSIQRDRSAHDLLEAIVYPSVSFVREYETYRIRTRTNEYVGIIQEKTPQAVVVGTAPETSVRVARESIVSMTLENTSVMPQGLDRLLTDQEMADLMAFLLGQDQDPETDSAILR